MMKNARGYESTSRENWDTETKHHRDNHQNDGHGVQLKHFRSLGVQK